MCETLRKIQDMRAITKDVHFVHVYIEKQWKSSAMCENGHEDLHLNNSEFRLLWHSYHISNYEDNTT